MKNKAKNKIISIVIPTFNEQKNISRIIKQLLKLDITYEMEIIIVDDNSIDGTSDLVRQFAQIDRRIRLISRMGRSGLSSAIKEGCLCASGEIIAVMDADGQHDPLYIKQALEETKIKEVDILVGSRFIKGSKIRGLSKRRQRSSSFANSLARLSLHGFYSYLTEDGLLELNGKIVFDCIDCLFFCKYCNSFL